jgi:hypothetical protein
MHLDIFWIICVTMLYSMIGLVVCADVERGRTYKNPIYKYIFRFLCGPLVWVTTLIDGMFK